MKKDLTKKEKELVTLQNALTTEKLSREKAETFVCQVVKTKNMSKEEYEHLCEEDERKCRPDKYKDKWRCTYPRKSLTF